MFLSNIVPTKEHRRVRCRYLFIVEDIKYLMFLHSLMSSLEYLIDATCNLYVKVYKSQGTQVQYYYQ